MLSHPTGQPCKQATLHQSKTQAIRAAICIRAARVILEHRTIDKQVVEEAKFNLLRSSGHQNAIPGGMLGTVAA